MEKVIAFLGAQLEEYRELVCTTNEIKDALLEGCNVDLLSDKVDKRARLLKALTSAGKDYESMCKIDDFSDNLDLKAHANGVFKEIRVALDSIASADAEIVSLMQKHIHDITLDIEKIQEGKNFMDNLKKQTCNPPVLVDVCG